ncbi:MAG: fructose-bisphosphate aldolase class I [Chloroflexi bacterium]|nr:fructose-bisphosphate aldolase class I [Chloroflexota bacterium]
MTELWKVARDLVAPGKGILAADESTSTIKRRFESIGVENTEPNRRAYRELLFRTRGANEFISGVILYDETIRQKAEDGTPLVRLLQEQGIAPGIKVDIGAKPLAGSPDETITEGLDGMRERLNEHRELGAVFTKWRAVINIGDGLPTDYAIRVNAHALGRFAALSQEAGLVPIVEPEVLMDGDHSIERCFEATRATQLAVFDELAAQRVRFDEMLLKPNMVLSGKSAGERAPAEQVARATLHCFLQTVPAAVPGIVFLSGGQSDDEATLNLDAINRRAAQIGGVPWQLTFSYGRGLQAAPQRAWSGKKDNVVAAQRAYYHRAKVTAAARMGKYSSEMEKGLVPA